MDVHAQPNVQKILLANKSDMIEQKEINKEEGEKIAAQYNMKFFETSAKTGMNIKEAFETIASQIILNIEE